MVELNLKYLRIFSPMDSRGLSVFLRLAIFILVGCKTNQCERPRQAWTITYVFKFSTKYEINVFRTSEAALFRTC